MLSSFSILKYRTFNEKTELSMKATSVSENMDSLLKGGYLPLTAVFGPNESGKSTFLGALRHVVEYISLPLLSSSCISFPAVSPAFTLTYTSGSHLYRYSLSFNNGEVQNEVLEKAEGEDRRFSLLFERNEEGVGYHGIFRNIGVRNIPMNMPLLTLLKAEHPDEADEPFRGIEKGFVFPSLTERSLSKEGKEYLHSLYKEIGLAAGHGYDELKLVLPAVVSSLENGSLLVVDNFLPSLHPALKRYILSLFTNPVSNRAGGAILFSSQDITLLDTSILRRDEIYFTERNEESSRLYRLTDIRDKDGASVRKDARLLKSYEEELYGSYPKLGRIVGWKDHSKAENRSKLFSINNRRYLGNKFRITRFIREIVDEHCPGVESFADIFSGTGSVSYAFRDKKLILNDFLYSNYLANLAWFSPEHFDSDKLSSLISSYNAFECNDDNYMSENFSDTYFSRENCRRIGFIREDIEKRYRKGSINMREKAILVVSLLYAMDRIAATCGHYDAWREHADLSAVLELRMLDADDMNNPDNSVFSEDANVLVRRIKADAVYIDPPYNSRQYSDAYHLLENVARWEKPEVSGKARKMDRKGIKSLYSTTEAEHVFADLIANIDAKYILLSYNNMHEKGDKRSNAKISDEAILSALSKRGEVSVYSTSHKAFSAGKSNIEGNEERIFLCRVRSKEKRKEGYIESPLNYVGGKGRILSDLLSAFPQEIDTFVDLFAGGCTVGVNAPCRRVIFNDSDPRLVSLLREMRKADKAEFIDDIFSVIDSYGLSRSDIHGYAYYGADSSKGLGNVNKESYLKLRQDFNSLSLSEYMRAVMLYVLIIYGFNNQIRFNDEGAFNLPVGKRDFNRKMQDKLSLFIDRIKELDAVFMDSDFRTVEIPSGSFVYADPPYLVTTATYNEKHGWTESDETSLHEILEALTARGIKFALSNTLRSRGKENTFLLSWLEKHPEYRIIHVDRSYANSNYHIKDRNAESDEVIILNY